MSFYATDLAFVHDAAFGGFACRIAPEIVRLLARACIGRGTVLELGCGSGITAEHLVARGYRVVGIDASPAMIRLARTRVPRATFRIGRIGSTRLSPCAAAIAVGEVVTYAIERPHGRRALTRLAARVHAVLEAGGLFVFDFMESAEGRTYVGKSHAGEGWAMTVSATTDPSGRWLTRRITLFRHVGGEFRRSQETHRVRLFDRQDVAAALAQAGFTVRFQRSLGRVRLMRGDVLAIARREQV